MREKKGFWELRDKQGRNTWAEEKYTSAQVLSSVGSFFPNLPRALAITFPPRCQVGSAGNLETSACFAQESQRNIWTGPMARPGLTQVLYQRTSALCKRPYPSTFYPTDPSWVDICAFCSRKDPLFQPRDGRSDHSHHIRPLHPSASSAFQLASIRVTKLHNSERSVKDKRYPPHLTSSVQSDQTYNSDKVWRASKSNTTLR